MFADLGGAQEWEPRNSNDWAARDALGPNQNWPRDESARYDAEVLFSAWGRLPPRLRAQTWREREIAAFLYRNSLEWQGRLGGLEFVGVSQRPWNSLAGMPLWPWPAAPEPLLYEYSWHIRHGDWGRARQIAREFSPSFGRDLLVGVLFVRWPTRDTTLLESVGIDPLVTLDSQIRPLEQYGLSPFVPLVIEPSQDQALLAAGAASVPAAAGLLLESGEPLEGMRPSGFGVPGTLTAIADAGSLTVLVGAHHVLGDPPSRVKVNGQLVAEVFDSDSVLDASVARVYDAIPVSALIQGLGLVPAAPVMPAVGVPVQFSRGQSGVQQGNWIDVTYKTAPAQYWLGTAPCFEMLLYAQPGDSGSLVLTGHGLQPPIDPAFAGQNPAFANLFTAAMVGMIIAGPNPPPAQGTTGRVIARPIFEIGKRFGLQWRVRP